MTTIPQPAAPTTSYAGTWDAWNRLVKLMDGMTTVGEYAYDGLFRRTKKVISGTTRHFYYSSLWQVLEERVGSAAAADRQFVWGMRYIDDLVLRDRDADSNPATGNLGITGSGLEERLYCIQDPNWNVTAVSNPSGAIQERYRYSTYGAPSVLTATFAPRAASLYAWEILFAGYRWDGESGLHHVRNRPLHSPLGRWPSRDPLGYEAGPHLYSYADARPLTAVDPTGQLSPAPAVGAGTAAGYGPHACVRTAGNMSVPRHASLDRNPSLGTDPAEEQASDLRRVPLALEDAAQDPQPRGTAGLSTASTAGQAQARSVPADNP